MNADYHFLIGRQFSVAGETYIVSALSVMDDRTWVEAHGARSGTRRRTFGLGEVLDWLVVDEEIELFNPNYLKAR